MNNRIKPLMITALSGALLVLATCPAAAEQPTTPSKTVGLGIGTSLYGGLSTLALPPMSVAVPIRLEPAWRLEPRVSASFVSTEHVDKRQSEAETERVEHDNMFLAVEASLDLHHLSQVSDNMFAYAGARVGTQRSWGDNYGLGALGSGAEIDNLHLLVGPVIGGEYLLGPDFSTGVETSLLYAYTSRRLETRSDGEVVSDETTRHTVSTGASLFLRMYLW